VIKCFVYLVFFNRQFPTTAKVCILFKIVGTFSKLATF